MTGNGFPPEAHFSKGEDHIPGAAARSRGWELAAGFSRKHLAHER